MLADTEKAVQAKHFDPTYLFMLKHIEVWVRLPPWVLHITELQLQFSLSSLLLFSSPFCPKIYHYGFQYTFSAASFFNFGVFLCCQQCVKNHLELNMHYEVLSHWELPDVCVFSKVKPYKG